MKIKLIAATCLLALGFAWNAQAGIVIEAGPVYAAPAPVYYAPNPAVPAYYDPKHRNRDWRYWQERRAQEAHAHDAHAHEVHDDHHR
jgi:hypothetical protein